MTLFGQESSISGAIWAGIGSIATVIVTTIVTAYISISKNRREGKKEDRKDAIGEWSGLVDRLNKSHAEDKEEMTKEVVDLKSEVKNLNSAESYWRSRAVKAEAKIESLQDKLAASNIPFRPYVPDVDEGSKVHPSLPEESKTK